MSTAMTAATATAARTIGRLVDNAGLGAERFTDLFQVMDSVAGHLGDEVVDRQRAVFGMRDAWSNALPLRDSG
jgi:hypothetical protein